MKISFFEIKKLLRQSFLLSYILFSTYSVNALAGVEKNSGAQNLIEWNSTQGLERLAASHYKNDFYQLINFYQPQMNPLYCGVASSVIVLNALRYNKISNQPELEVVKPKTLGGGIIEFRSYSQINFLNAKTDKIKKREIIELKQANIAKNGEEFFDAGLTLTQLKDILTEVYKLHAKIFFAKENDQNSLENFRANLKKYLLDDKNFVIVNFDGKLLGTKTQGHISPVVAYDEASDSVLVLDVALHKQTWYFASLAKLYAAMNSKDGEGWRGYLVVSE